MQLQRTRALVNGQLSISRETDWEGVEHYQLLQRIANYHVPYIPPRQVERLLEAGETVKTKYSSYILIESESDKDADAGANQPIRDRKKRSTFNKRSKGDPKTKPQVVPGDKLESQSGGNRDEKGDHGDKRNADGAEERK